MTNLRQRDAVVAFSLMLRIKGHDSTQTGTMLAQTDHKSEFCQFLGECSIFGGDALIPYFLSDDTGDATDGFRNFRPKTRVCHAVEISLHSHRIPNVTADFRPDTDHRRATVRNRAEFLMTACQAKLRLTAAGA